MMGFGTSALCAALEPISESYALVRGICSEYRVYHNPTAVHERARQTIRGMYRERWTSDRPYAVGRHTTKTNVNERQICDEDGFFFAFGHVQLRSRYRRYGVCSSARGGETTVLSGERRSWPVVFTPKSLKTIYPSMPALESMLVLAARSNHGQATFALEPGVEQEPVVIRIDMDLVGNRERYLSQCGLWELSYAYANAARLNMTQRHMYNCCRRSQVTPPTVHAASTLTPVLNLISNQPDILILSRLPNPHNRYHTDHFWWRRRRGAGRGNNIRNRYTKNAFLFSTICTPISLDAFQRPQFQIIRHN